QPPVSMVTMKYEVIGGSRLGLLAKNHDDIQVLVPRDKQTDYTTEDSNHN
ncbi:hypothetical protein A2U01_0067935, partial [Trifolium medium]|nr:hypothetical protein [Trifolium medium]